MQFTHDAHPAIAAGKITLTFRRWQRPHAKVGGHYTVGGVVIEVDDIDHVPFASISAAELRRAGVEDKEALRALAAHSGPVEDDTILHRIEFHVAGPRSEPTPSPTDAATVAHVAAKLDRMDARSTHGVWTRETLRLIGACEGVVSTDLAEQLRRDRIAFKADVRKLKALGLTESLETGYRLTALGRLLVAG